MEHLVFDVHCKEFISTETITYSGNTLYTSQQPFYSSIQEKIKAFHILTQFFPIKFTSDYLLTNLIFWVLGDNINSN